MRSKTRTPQLNLSDPSPHPRMGPEHTDQKELTFTATPRHISSSLQSQDHNTYMLRQFLILAVLVTLFSLATADKKTEFCFKTLYSKLQDSYFRVTAEIKQGTDPITKNPWKLTEALSGHEYSAQTQEMIGYVSGLRYLNESGFVEEIFVASLRGEFDAAPVDEFSGVPAPNTFQRVRAITWNNELRIGGEYFAVVSDPSKFLYRLEQTPVDLETVWMFPCNETSEVLRMSADEQARAALAQMGPAAPASSVLKVDEAANEDVCFRKNGLGSADVHVPFFSRNQGCTISYYTKMDFPAIISSSINKGRIHHLSFVNPSGSPYVKVLTTSFEDRKYPVTRPNVDFTENGYTDMMSFTGVPGAADYWTC